MRFVKLISTDALPCVRGRLRWCGAPKDGTHILLWGDSYHSVFSGYYDDKWSSVVGWHKSGGILITSDPTHWMPLPLPPGQPTQEENRK